MKKSTCAMCGCPTKLMPAEFELRAFTYRGGKNVGDIGYTITPQGMIVEKCYTNRGCGEQFFSMKTAEAMDKAQAVMNERYPELLTLLRAIRRESAVKAKRKTSRRS